jgi:3-(3-hydroxy-phenyl)propionate hydroxylase
VPGHVAIVGAGPVGLTAAALLAGYGVRSTVFEAHDEPYPLPRAVHVDDEVMRTLQRVGVAGELRRGGLPAAGLRLCRPDLSPLVEFRRGREVGEHGWPQALLFDQPDLERLLRKRSIDLPEVDVRYGARIGALTPTGVRTAGRSLAFDAVLGCDGANSTVREAIGGTLRGGRFEERWLVVDVRTERELAHWAGVHQVCDPGRAATYMRIGPDRYRWEFRIASGRTAEELDLSGLLAPWLGGPDLTGIEVLRRAGYTFRALVADRWRAGRVFLLGDAAHLTPPFIGQGLGAGLRDAANLCWKLASVLAGRAGEDLLDTYQAERAPHVTSVVRTAVAVGWVMTSGGPGARVVRGLLPALDAVVPALSRQVTATLSPRLRVRGGTGRFAGTVFPQPFLEDGTRLDDRLGPGFSVLRTRPAHPELAELVSRLEATDLLVDPGTELHRWMSDHRIGAALLRPDRVVHATERPGDRVGRRLVRSSAILA